MPSSWIEFIGKEINSNIDEFNRYQDIDHIKICHKIITATYKCN